MESTPGQQPELVFAIFVLRVGFSHKETIVDSRKETCAQLEIKEPMGMKDSYHMTRKHESEDKQAFKSKHIHARHLDKCQSSFEQGVYHR